MQVYAAVIMAMNDDELECYLERLPNRITTQILHVEGIAGKLNRDAKIFGVWRKKKGV